MQPPSPERSLRITRAARDAILAHALQGYPCEVVGLLARRSAEPTIVRAVRLVNEARANATMRFVVGRDALDAAERDLHADGLEIGGWYHSHPDRAAECSPQDRARAGIDVPQIIVAVDRRGVVATRCWVRPDPRRLEELTILSD